MPRPFVQLSREEFLDLLRRFRFTRKIDAVHMHHTFIPRKTQFRGVGTIEAMERDHRQRGFSDIAQHITIAPDGTVWTGRSWNQAPASATGHNGNSVSGPFMFETVGDFDRGEEVLGGDQKETVLATIVAIQKQFGLSPESLRFHNQMSSKTCPGSAIDYDDFLEEVRARHRESEEQDRARGAARAAGAPFGTQHAEEMAASAPVQRALETLSRAVSRGFGDEGEPDETDLSAERRAFLAGDGDYTEAAPDGGARGLFGPRRLTADEKASLRPHVINLREGRLIEGGEFFSLEGDVRALFTEHLEEEAERRQKAGEKLRVLFYAHGGLASERSGLHRALSHVQWWKKNGVYPIYFVWETGLLQQIGQLIRERGGARGFVDELVEASDAKIEKAARRLGGERIWSGMKRNAEAAAAPGGGSALAADLLAQFCARHPGVELHAVGHSAGAIFHGHFLPAAFAKGVPPFESVHFMAPAIRLDTFRDRLIREVGGNVKQLTMFTMKTDFELADNCATLYRKSLLYLIRFALEPEERAELLGLEESLRRSPDLVKLFGLEGNPRQHGEIVFSRTLAESGRSASRSEEHGGFDDDGPTMNSIALRVLGLPDNGTIEPYPEKKGSRALEEDPWAAPDLSDLFPQTPQSFAPAMGIQVPASSPAIAAAPVRPAVFPSNPAPGGGARRALCVGINAYRDKPLGGCVADARLWERTLQGIGFSTTRLLDAEATYERLRAELRQLVTSSRPGDVVVFQYAGHGTQAPDLDADEADGEAGPDEALCPVDCHNGPLLIDDDIAEILAELPDGVNFTFFMDNCNSGGVSRFGFGAAPRAAGENAQSRFLPMTEEMKQAYTEFRKSRQARGGSRAFSRGARRPLRGVLFAACQADELAWEVNGQGEFTVRATPLLQAAGPGGLTNREFQDRVLQTFGSSRRQTPQLRCEDEFLSRPLLAPLAGFGGGGAGRGLAGGAPLALAEEIQRLAERLRGFNG
jgi:hypothetical protein